jgi:hypothetical protein
MRDNISAASAMPARSAAMLKVLAMKSAKATAITTGLGSFCRSAPASPLPVAIATRAQVICTAAISGKVTKAVQSWVVPSSAPAAE